MRSKAVCSLLFGVVCTIMCSVVGLTPANASSAWVSDGAGWRGHGSAFLPGGTFVGDADSGSDCPGCSWEVDPVCELTGPHNCQEAFGCPPGQPFVLIRVTDPAAGVAGVVGSQCLPPGEPISVEEIGQFVQDRVRQQTPQPDPNFQPRGQTLTMLPTIFWTEQPQTIDRSDVLAGLSVHFTAIASWYWNWGDGSRPRVTHSPGSPWPRPSLTHTFRRAGRYPVSTRTTWDATFWVNGVGPFAPSGPPVTQQASFVVPVREARAVLVK